MIVEFKKQVEVDLPYFSKNNAYAYKVIDENTCISVAHSEHIKRGVCESYVSFAFDEQNEKITEDEFNTLFNQTLKIIQEL
jgi:hypothetical protein